MSGIIIDVTRLVTRRLRKRLPTGIDRVGLAYLEHYADQAQAALAFGNGAVVLSRAASERLFRLLGSTGQLSRNAIAGLVASSLGGPFRPDVRGAWLLNTGHAGLHRPGYARMPASLGVRPLHVIHDLIPITHPQFCRAGEDKLHAQRMALALRTGAAIVCNSRTTFDDLADFALRQGLPLPPATVALLATDLTRVREQTASGQQTGGGQQAGQDEAPGGGQAGGQAAPGKATTSLAPSVDDSPPLVGPYFLMLGTIEPRKNHLLVLQVWQRLVRAQGAQAPRLVVVGQIGWECEHVLRLLERAPELKDHIVVLQRCGDADLASWMRHARALLFPSFVEGFGLPVLESLERGLPVIAADLPVYREFAGDLPEYLDPLDAASWQSAIAAYAVPGDRRRERRLQALAGFRGPTWAGHFARVDALMRRVDDGRNPSSVPPRSPETVTYPT